MTVLDSFVAFTKALPADRLQSVEDALGLLMQTHLAGRDFNADELTELDRRLAEPKVEYANPKDISGLFGKPFPG
jgi:hypothetical protein